MFTVVSPTLEQCLKFSRFCKELSKWRAIPFMDRKTQCGQDASSSQLDLQIQGNPNQNLGKLFFGY